MDSKFTKRGVLVGKGNEIICEFGSNSANRFSCKREENVKCLC